MKIQYCSDLHLEFPENKKFLKSNPLQIEGEILLMAGYIVPFAAMNDHKDFFDYISDNFKYTYWIFGHHHQNISDFKIGKTKLITNQLGYVKYNEHKYFSHEKHFFTS